MTEEGNRGRGGILRQPGRECLKVREAVLRSLLHQAVDGILKGARKVRTGLGQGGRLVPGHGIERVHQIAAEEGMHSRGQFVEHHAEAELVGLACEGLAISLLRAHVGGSALAVARCRPLHEGHVMRSGA